jgi:seryl-tRNA synthetase
LHDVDNSSSYENLCKERDRLCQQLTEIDCTENPSKKLIGEAIAQKLSHTMKMIEQLDSISEN